jgi:hypothetical protein
MASTAAEFVPKKKTTHFFSLGVLWPTLLSARINGESGGGIGVIASDELGSPSNEVCVRIFGRVPFSPIVR